MIVFVCTPLLVQFFCSCFFFFQAEDGIRDLVRSRGLGDVYKRQNFVRALVDGGFADLHHPEYWDLGFMRHAELHDALSLIHI